MDGMAWAGFLLVYLVIGVPSCLVAICTYPVGGVISMYEDNHAPERSAGDVV